MWKTRLVFREQHLCVPSPQKIPFENLPIFTKKYFIKTRVEKVSLTNGVTDHSLSQSCSFIYISEPDRLVKFHIAVKRNNRTRDGGRFNCCSEKDVRHGIFSKTRLTDIKMPGLT